jgi:dTDP-4-dehydrorhamnose 3,5-epimerase/reductase
LDDSRFLIAGAGGQLGLALQAKYQNARAADSKQLDISDWASISSFDWNNISTILNAAGHTDVDGAETAEGRVAAWKVNAQGAANLARIAADKDLTLVHVSTDYVFDGTKGPHTEAEPFSPLSVYGASKAAGDIAVGSHAKHYILRTSWVIGEGKNFVRTMLDLGQKGVAPTVVHDQIGRLTFTSVLAGAIGHLLSAQSPFGTYNVSNEGEPVSWADITRTIFHEASFDLKVTDTTTKEYYQGKTGIAPRPLNSSLDLGKLEAAGFTPNNWHDDLRDYIKKELTQ